MKGKNKTSKRCLEREKGTIRVSSTKLMKYVKINKIKKKIINVYFLMFSLTLGFLNVIIYIHGSMEFGNQE